MFHYMEDSVFEIAPFILHLTGSAVPHSQFAAIGLVVEVQVVMIQIMVEEHMGMIQTKYLVAVPADSWASRTALLAAPDVEASGWSRRPSRDVASSACHRKSNVQRARRSTRITR